jgi:hypothetical protein
MKGKLNFFVMILLMFIVFYGLIKYIFDVSGWKFVVEFLILLGLLVFGALSLLLIYNDVNFGYTLSALVGAVALLNLVVLYFSKSMSTVLFASIISSMTAFVISVVNIGQKEVEIVEEKPVEKKILKTYTPGKVVSSKTSNVYHVPKCDWAKKIKKSNQVWYASDEEAKKEGLKAHSCAK